MLGDYPGLNPFERCQLINRKYVLSFVNVTVSPDTVAEAKHLIPSLNDMRDEADENQISDDRLQDLLDELKRLRKYT